MKKSSLKEVTIHKSREVNINISFRYNHYTGKKPNYQDIINFMSHNARRKHYLEKYYIGYLITHERLSTFAINWIENDFNLIMFNGLNFELLNFDADNQSRMALYTTDFVRSRVDFRLDDKGGLTINCNFSISENLIKKKYPLIETRINITPLLDILDIPIDEVKIDNIQKI